MDVTISSVLGERKYRMNDTDVIVLSRIAEALGMNAAVNERPEETGEPEPIVEEKKLFAPRIPEREKPSRNDSLFGSDWRRSTRQETGYGEADPQYKGFMIIKCKKCGTVKGFCSKGYIRSYHCNECQEDTELGRLKRAFVDCECGRKYKYFTNIDEDRFEWNCLDCGTPIDLVYNERKDIYETLRERRR